MSVRTAFRGRIVVPGADFLCCVAFVIVMALIGTTIAETEWSCEDADELALQLKDEGRLEESKKTLLQLIEVCPEDAGEKAQAIDNHTCCFCIFE